MKTFKEFLTEAKISNDIISALAKDRTTWKTIKKDLSLPIIPKGKYIGSGKWHDCFTNTKKSKLLKYEGWLIWKDEDGWQIVNHFFNVEDGKVIEMTPLEDKWDKNTYYIGKKMK
jgi:hypothetical protein